jgi:hypothetical protein
VGELSPWQVRRAAWMLHRVLDFKQQLDTYVRPCASGALL